MNRELDANLALLGEGLAVEEQSYETCPECGRDGKLALKRTSEGLLFYCLRATCGLRGFVGNLGAVQARTGDKPDKGLPRRTKPFEGRLQGLTETQYLWFWMRFGIGASVLDRYGVRYAPDKGAYAYDVADPRGYSRGLVLRYYDGSKPKTVAYPEHTDLPWQAWHVRDELRGAPLVVVEDQVSAMKAASHVNAVALLGTNLNTAGALEIAETQPSEVIIALDYDATATAHQMAGAYGLLFRNVRVLALERDLKDTGHAELRRLLSE